MIVPDVNLLLYAHVAAFPEHALARRWWEGRGPGPQHLRIAFGLLRHVGAGANLTTDAQLAALAIEHQGEVHSNASEGIAAWSAKGRWLFAAATQEPARLLGIRLASRLLNE